MRIKETIGKYLPFAWWVLLAIFSIAGIVAGAMLIGADMTAGRFFGICAIIASCLSVCIYAVLAWAEWADRNNYD